MKGTYQRIRNLWKKPKQGLGALWKERLIMWRRDPVTLRIPRPTRLDRARQAGYRAKQGIFIVRQRVISGPHKRPKIKKGRKPRKSRQIMILQKNYQSIAEERTAKAFKNCEILNSYFVAKDGKHYWYEIIVVDRAHPAIKSDKKLGWMSSPANRGRAFRGLSSSSRKSRGLRRKGKGAEKIRPSRH